MALYAYRMKQKPVRPIQSSSKYMVTYIQNRGNTSHMIFIRSNSQIKIAHHSNRVHVPITNKALQNCIYFSEYLHWSVGRLMFLWDDSQILSSHPGQIVVIVVCTWPLDKPPLFAIRVKWKWEYPLCLAISQVDGSVCNIHCWRCRGSFILFTLWECFFDITFLFTFVILSLKESYTVSSFALYCNLLIYVHIYITYTI